MKTTQIFSFSSLIFLTLASASSALAIEAPRPTIRAIRQDVRTEIKTNIRETREDINDLRLSVTPGLRGTIRPTITEIRTEAKATRQTALDGAKKQVVTKIYTNLRDSLNKRYTTLNEAFKKIQDKVAAKAALGKDVATVNTQLAQITTAQTTFTTDMTALDAKFNQIIASDKPWTMIAQLRASGKKVETDLQQIRKLEVAALKSLLKL